MESLEQTINESSFPAHNSIGSYIEPMNKAKYNLPSIEKINGADTLILMPNPVYPSFPMINRKPNYIIENTPFYEQIRYDDSNHRGSGDHINIDVNFPLNDGKRYFPLNDRTDGHSDR